MRIREGAVVECRNCVFSDNDLEPGGRGAAIYISGTMTRRPRLTLTNSTLGNFYRLTPLFNSASYPGEVSITKSTLPSVMENAEYFTDKGGNLFTPWDKPEPTAYELTPAEFIFLLFPFQPEVVIGIEDVLTGRSPEETEKVMTQALDMLIRRGYVTSSPRGETVPTSRLRAWLSVCAYPNVVLSLVATDEKDETQAYFYYAPEFIIASLKEGEHFHLRRISQEEVESFLRERFPCRDKPAAHGDPVTVGSDVFERLQPLLNSKDMDAVTQILEEAGCPTGSLVSLATAVAELVASSTLLLQRFGWPRATKALQVLETPSGVWVIRMEEESDRYTFVPASSNEAYRMMVAIAQEAYSVVA